MLQTIENKWNEMQYIIRVNALYDSIHHTSQYIIRVNTLYDSIHYTSQYIIRVNTLYESIHHTSQYIIRVLANNTFHFFLRDNEYLIHRQNAG